MWSQRGKYMRVATCIMLYICAILQIHFNCKFLLSLRGFLLLLGLRLLRVLFGMTVKYACIFLEYSSLLFTCDTAKVYTLNLGHFVITTTHWVFYCGVSGQKATLSFLI